MATVAIEVRSRKQGCLHQVTGVVLADHFAARLRGWFGYQRRAEIAAVWLTQTGALHTVGMSLRLDLMWLNTSGRCVHWEPNVRPGQWRCVRGASQVVEWRSGVLPMSITARLQASQKGQDCYITRTEQ